MTKFARIARNTSSTVGIPSTSEMSTVSDLRPKGKAAIRDHQDVSVAYAAQQRIDLGIENA